MDRILEKFQDWTLNCSLEDVHTKLDQVDPHHGVIYTRNQSEGSNNTKNEGIWTFETSLIRQFHQQNFPGSIITKNSGVNWPPRSCELTLLDQFFFWLCEKPDISFSEVEPQLFQKCQNVIENFSQKCIFLYNCKRRPIDTYYSS